MKEYLVLDGYNVINAWPRLKEIAHKDLALARVELIDMMIEYRTYSGLEIIVVFDAHLVKGNNGTKEILSGIEIVYTKERETADAYIEKAIIEITKRNRAVVATNDWAEQQMILGGGATRISVRELILDFSNMKTTITRDVSRQTEQKDVLSTRVDPITLKKLEKLRRSR
ncbi:NYN domain-containing protein [Serpentinicella sp. ANB-PHB4]|uniref:NYN domain-containing protein n=1 Tax=Serpentinicella sp. ANB-PHB4 TaxID=3074076 RepID=UPI002861FB03|nr:NYN domain-containing protein [Serpentinicella sp. ANB-PHB4]MDR5659931.1 NYN domain-containing protein [Serpentinicella sp. ANB-PHB4]